MNKLKKMRVFAMIIFIVLMLSNVYAMSEGGTTPAIAGSATNPFVISLSGSASTQTVEYTSLPFYFDVQTAGTYEIVYEPKDKKVTFIFVENKNSSTTVLLDETAYDKVSNWQVGVAPQKNDGIGVATPMYSIYESLVYTSGYNVTNGGSYYGGNVSNSLPEMVTNAFGGTITRIGTSEKSTVSRLTQLRNVTVRASLAASRGNLYFFDKTGERPMRDLISPLGYTVSDQANSFDYYKTNKTSESNTILVSQSDGNATLIYRFDGNSNSALDGAEGDSNGIEGMLTYLALTIGDNLLLGMLQRVFGQNLTIDALIFNRFEHTKVDLYSSSATRYQFSFERSYKCLV